MIDPVCDHLAAPGGLLAQAEQCRQNKQECRGAGACQAQQLYQHMCINRSALQGAHIVESLVLLSIPGLLIACILNNSASRRGPAGRHHS